MRLMWLEVSGVKTFTDRQTMPIRNINLIYGSNSSGKSTLIQSLLLLKQSLSSALSADGEVLAFRGATADLGDFQTFVHGHDVERPIELAFGVDKVELSSLGGRAGLEVRLSFVYSPTSPGRSRLHRLSLRRLDDNREIEFGFRDDGSADLEGRAFSSLLELFEERRAFGSNQPADVSEKDARWLRDWCRQHPMTTRFGWFPYWTPGDTGLGKTGRPYGGSRSSPRGEMLRDFAYVWWNEIYLFMHELRDLFFEAVYVGPLREFPRRIGSDVRQGVGIGTRGERLVVHLAKRPELVTRVNEAFDRLEIGYELSVENIASESVQSAVGELAVALLKDRQTGIVLSPADVGFGISQVLPIVVQLLGNSDTLILIEQPEIHLHPKLQSRLADLIVESARELGNTIVVETHSDHLLYRIQRRFREGSIDPVSPSSFLGVYYVFRVEAGGRIASLRVGAAGELLDPWPGGFFDDSLDDLLAAT